MDLLEQQNVIRDNDAPDDEVEEDLGKYDYESKSVHPENVSITEQVQSIEVLMAKHELEEAKAKVKQIEKQLDQHQSQLLTTQSLLKEKEEMISKLKLERDLADAERRMTKQQVSMLLDVKGALDNNAAQFCPIDHNTDEFPGSLESDLLNDLQNQRDLHKIIMKHLVVTKSSSIEDPAMMTMDKSKLNSKSWYKNITTRKKMCVRMKGRKKQHKLYHAVKDCYPEQTISSNKKGISDQHSWLINEIQSFDTKNHENMVSIQSLVRSQSNRIHLLQHEIEKLIAMQIACGDGESTSTDDRDCCSVSSDDSFFSVGSRKLDKE